MGQVVPSRCRKVGCRNRARAAGLCAKCNDLRAARSAAIIAKANATRRSNHPERHRPAGDDMVLWKRLAGRAVALAVKQGILPPLDGSVPCVDCGEPAREYDHRDYRLILAVSPVCRSCNCQRGCAIYPSAQNIR